jgi:hypothetical protein
LRPPVPSRPLAARLLSLAGALLLGAPFPVLADDFPPPDNLIADEAELQAMLSGNTRFGTLGNGPGLWVEYYCSNGISIYLYHGRVYDGHWAVRSGQVCFSYDSPGLDKPYCYSVYRKRDGYLLHSTERRDGFAQTSNAAHPLPGDPFALRAKSRRGCSRRDEPSA